MVGAGGERLRGIGAYPLRNPVQLGALVSAFVLARCMLMSPLLYIVSFWSVVARDRDRADAAVRVRWRVVVPVGGSWYMGTGQWST